MVVSSAAHALGKSPGRPNQPLASDSRHSRLLVYDTAQVDHPVAQSLVKPVAGNTQRGIRQFALVNRVSRAHPGELTVPTRIGQTGGDPQSIQGGLVHPGNELPAYPVTRIAPGFMQADRHVAKTQARSERQTR